MSRCTVLGAAMASFSENGGAPVAPADWLWSGWEPWALDAWSDPAKTPVTDHPNQGPASLDGIGNGANAWGERWASPEPWSPAQAGEGADADESELVNQHLAAFFEATGTSAPNPLGLLRMLEEAHAPGSQSAEELEEDGSPPDDSGSEKDAEAMSSVPVERGARRGQADTLGHSGSAQPPALRVLPGNAAAGSLSCRSSEPGESPRASSQGLRNARVFTGEKNIAALHSVRASARGGPGLLQSLKRAVGGGGAAVTHVVEAREALSEEQRGKVREALKKAVMKQEPQASAAIGRRNLDKPCCFSSGGTEGVQGRLMQVVECISEKRRAEVGEALKRAVAWTKEGGQNSVGISGRLSSVASDSSGSHPAIASQGAQSLGGSLGEVRARTAVQGASLASRLAETVQALPTPVQLAQAASPPSALASGSKAKTFESFDFFLRILAGTCPTPGARGPQQSGSTTQRGDDSTQGTVPVQGREIPPEAPGNRPSPPPSSLEDEELPGNFLSDGRFLISSLQLLKRDRRDWSVPAVAPLPPNQKLRTDPKALQASVCGLPAGAPFQKGNAGKGERHAPPPVPALAHVSPLSLRHAPALALAVAPAQRSLVASASDGWHTEVLRSRLTSAAQAVDSGNIGRASERWVHMMLETLFLRVAKKGALALDAKPRKMSLQELITSRYFCTKEAPFVVWASVFFFPMIVPRLLGHRNVHIICWSDPYLSQIPIIMKALAGDRDAPALGAPRARLERMRVTVFDPHSLVSKRNDLDSMKTWGLVRQFMVQEAAKLGVEMDFRVLYPEAGKMGCFETVQPREDEVVAAALLFVMLRSSDDPRAGGGTRIHLMKLLKQMRPVIVAFGEEEFEASGDCFLQRFQCCLDSCFKQCHAMDTVRGGRDMRLLIPFENVWTRLHAVSILSCDGPERLVRPLSQASWHAWFRSWGFQGLPVSQPVLDGVTRVLEDYSSDFRSSYDGTALWLSWQGRRMLHATCWALSDPHPAL